MLSKVPQPSFRDSDREIDINDERYLIGLCVEAYVNSPEVLAVDNPRDIAEFPAYRQLRQLFVNGPVDLRFATLNKGAKFFYSESVGMDSVNMINLLGAKCTGLEVQVMQSENNLCRCKMMYADVEECTFEGRRPYREFRCLEILDSLGNIVKSRFRNCMFYSIDSRSDISERGNYFEDCRIHGQMSVNSPRLEFKGVLKEIRIEQDSNIDGADLNVYAGGSQGVDFYFSSSSHGVVFWNGKNSLHSLRVEVPGSQNWDGKVNMAIVPIGETTRILRFPYKNEMHPDFNLVLTTLGLMLEYLVGDDCTSEYLERPEVKDLIANGYKVVGPDGLHYAVVLGENGKAISKIETRDDKASRRRNRWRGFLAKSRI